MKLKPSSLFKYLTINKNTMSALIGNYLYFSSPMNFNDPFDSRLHLFGEGNDELWEKYFLKNGLESIPKDHKKAIKQQLFDL